MIRLVVTDGGVPQQWVDWMRAQGLAPATIAQRRSLGADLIARVPGWRTATPDDIASWLARPGWSPETRKAARGAARSLYRWAVLTGRATADPTTVIPSVRVPRHTPRPCPDAPLARALHDADQDELLMVMLAATMGLRCGEIAAVHGDDVQGGWLLVHGKGGRERLVPVHPAVAPALAGLAGWAFPSPRGGHVTPQRVGRRLSLLLGPGWTAHTLRHRAATQAYQGTHDLLAVRDLLGHASVSTTQQYTASGDEAVVAAVEATALPRARHLRAV